MVVTAAAALISVRFEWHPSSAWSSRQLCRIADRLVGDSKCRQRKDTTKKRQKVLVVGEEDSQCLCVRCVVVVVVGVGVSRRRHSSRGSCRCRRLGTLLWTTTSTMHHASRAAWGVLLAEQVAIVGGGTTYYMRRTRSTK